MSDTQDQRSIELNSSAPPPTRNVGRAAFAAFILGSASVFALLVACCGPLMPIAPRVGFFLTSIGATALAIPAVIRLRKAARDNPKAWPHARHGLFLSSVIVGLFLALFAVSQGVERNYRRINQIKCESNLKIIGQSMLLYAQNNNGQFPQHFSQLFGDIGPQFFICPASDDRPATGSTTQAILADFAKPGQCSYIYLAAGQSMSTVPKNFVLTYEPLGNHEKEGAHFIFGDGNVEWLDAKDAQRAIDQLSSGANPPKK